MNVINVHDIFILPFQNQPTVFDFKQPNELLWIAAEMSAFLFWLKFQIPLMVFLLLLRACKNII